jgi:2-hydroxychromene-2-carboxylate isomerase
VKADETTVDFHFDLMCPFAYQTSLWIREIRDQLGITVNWRFFSLEEMRIGALLRRHDMADLDVWYARVGRALHRDGQKPHRPEVARQLLADIGLDPQLVDAAIADQSTHDEVKADQQQVVDAGGFGVPTLFFADEQCLYGPVLIDPPTGKDAVRLWEATIALLEFPHVYETQRPKTPSNRKDILETLSPYLPARDWASIDRGQLNEFPDVPAAEQAQ